MCRPMHATPPLALALALALLLALQPQSSAAGRLGGKSSAPPGVLRAHGLTAYAQVEAPPKAKTKAKTNLRNDDSCAGPDCVDPDFLNVLRPTALRAHSRNGSSFSSSFSPIEMARVGASESWDSDSQKNVACSSSTGLTCSQGTCSFHVNVLVWASGLSLLDLK